MPQLSPLPWLMFMLVSFIPLVCSFLVSEVILGEVKNIGSGEGMLLFYKW